MPAVLICVIGAVSLPAGPAAVIEPGQAAFGGLFVLMGEVEAGLIHGFADHVVADISGAAEAVAQVAVVVNHIANKHIAHLERKRQAAEFDVPVDDLPVGRSAKKEKSKSQVPSPDAFLESQRKAARIQQEPSVPFDEEPISGNTVIPSAHQEEFGARAVSEEELLEFTPEADADIAQAVMQAVAPIPEEPALEKVSAKDARASAQMVAQEIAENADGESRRYVRSLPGVPSKKYRGTAKRQLLCGAPFCTMCLNARLRPYAALCRVIGPSQGRRALAFQDPRERQ